MDKSLMDESWTKSLTRVRRESDGRPTNQGRNDGNVVAYNAATVMVL